MIRIRLLQNCYVGGARRNAGEVLEITDGSVQSTVAGLVRVGFALVVPDIAPEPVPAVVFRPVAPKTEYKAVAGTAGKADPKPFRLKGEK